MIVFLLLRKMVPPEEYTQQTSAVLHKHHTKKPVRWCAGVVLDPVEACFFFLSNLVMSAASKEGSIRKQFEKYPGVHALTEQLVHRLRDGTFTGVRIGP
jgi:hypothetical protein